MANASPIAIKIAPAYRGKVAPDLLRRAAEVALAQAGAAPTGAVSTGTGELTIVVTGDRRIRELNRQYLGEDRPTDVLAFPSANLQAPLHAAQDKLFVAAPEAATYLGDIILSYPRAREQAEAAGHPVEAELQLLVVHGVLHLLGYDHAGAEEKAHMWALQGQVLRTLGLSISLPDEEE